MAIIYRVSAVLTLCCTLLVMAVFFALSTVCDTASVEPPSVSIFDDTRGYVNVILENDHLRAVFRRDPRPWGGWKGFRSYCIKEFRLKSLDYDLAAGYICRLDDDMAKSAIGRAVVTDSSRSRVTVRLEYDPAEAPCTGEAVGRHWCNENVQQITLYAGVPVLKIEYLRYNLFAVDYTDWPDEWNTKRKVSYGDRDWIYSLDPTDRGKPYSHNEDNKWYQGTPADGGAIAYRGHFIVGEYLVERAVGYARVISVESTRQIKLWDNGWEIFLQGERPVSWLFAVRGGREQILAAGKAIVDWTLAGENGLMPWPMERSE